MPTAATMAGNAPAAQQGKNAPAQPVVPFTRASFQNRQAMGFQQSRLITAAIQDLGVIDVPAYGFLRSIVLVVSATGAVGGTLAENGPWNVLQNISLTEPNGAPIVQVNDGFQLYLINKWGGYSAGVMDPKAQPSYSADGAGNFTFILRIPVEINAREALGSLPNQNSASSFKMRLSLTNSATLYSAITTPATVSVTAYMECWDQPSENAAGQVNQLTPPALNTTSFWSTSVFNLNAGFQTIRLNRLGNYLRNLIFITQRTGSTRVNGEADFPDPLNFLLDARPMDTLAKTVWKEQMFKRCNLTPGAAAEAANGLNNGVYVYDFMHDFDGEYGFELRNGWLGTLGSERLEFNGSFGNADTVTVLTNDVAVNGSVWS